MVKANEKSSVFKWSGLYSYSYGPDHSKTDLQNVRFSNVSGFRRVGFRILTVVWYSDHGDLCFFY